MVVNNSIDMNNRCATLESFRSKRPRTETPATVETPEGKPDVVEVSKPSTEPPAPAAETVKDESNQAPKQKRSFFQKCKDVYAFFKKGVITSWEYTKGFAKGLFFGGLAASSVLGIDAVAGMVKKSEKALSTRGKVIAGAVGAVIMGYQLFQSHLNSNERCADVDHRWGTGHNK